MGCPFRLLFWHQRLSLRLLLTHRPSHTRCPLLLHRVTVWQVSSALTQCKLYSAVQQGWILRTLFMMQTSTLIRVLTGSNIFAICPWLVKTSIPVVEHTLYMSTGYVAYKREPDIKTQTLKIYLYIFAKTKWMKPSDQFL